jgi:hypothetical protein
MTPKPALRDHPFTPQPGSQMCVCGLPHDALAESLLSNEHVQRRLGGEPHRHHPDCIHNLPPDEQIALRGRTCAWWEAMGLAVPVQITSADWGTGDV